MDPLRHPSMTSLISWSKADPSRVALRVISLQFRVISLQPRVISLKLRVINL
jgi:hypothetical protein